MSRLDVGPQYVTQGLTLSCTLFLIYILGMSMMFHDTRHSPEDQLKCPRENQKTFVDDNLIIVKKHPDKTLSQTVTDTMM